MRKAKAGIHSAELKLSFTKIRSPITGIIGLSSAQIGDLVGPGGSTHPTLTTVSLVDPIRAYIAMSERDYLRYATRADNQQVSSTLELILADGSRYPHTGKFYVADRQVAATTGTIKVAALFPNPGNVLRPGQFARLRAMVRTKYAALLVPQQAVTELQGGYQIAVVKAYNTVDIRKVKPAERVDSLWVIDEGLQPGERVVSGGVQAVRQGMKVSPQTPGSSDTPDPLSNPEQR